MPCRRTTGRARKPRNAAAKRKTPLRQTKRNRKVDSADGHVRGEIGRKTMVVSANRLELLQIADAVAREKSIDK
ncbi:hypothetical protein EN822_26705, partial [bacterium M00.F.Ca.ET.179.01.1.1]